MLNEHDRVVLTIDIPGEGLLAGDVGAIVHIHSDGQAYQVEFLSLDGHTVAIATVPVTDVRPVTRQDITHARKVATAA